MMEISDDVLDRARSYRRGTSRNTPRSSRRSHRQVSDPSDFDGSVDMLNVTPRGPQ